MVLVRFQDEELNFFKFTRIALGEFPKALRQAFVSKWDKTYGNRPGYQPWDDTLAVRNLFLGTEGGKTKVPTHLSYNEWDCTALFQATIYARSFALNRKSRHYKTLDDLYVSPCKPPPGSFHRSVKSPTGKSDETFALAIDQLRLLRNALCHSSSSKLDKVTFDLYLQHAKDAYNALGITTVVIDAIGSLTESDFPTEKVNKLMQDINEELRAHIKFLKDTGANKEDIAALDQKITEMSEGRLGSSSAISYPDLCLLFFFSAFECDGRFRHLPERHRTTENWSTDWTSDVSTQFVL